LVCDIYLEESNHFAATMASFFDLKARRQAAATNGSSAPKTDDPKKNTRKQPWVEK
jgi:replication factor C subunit 2/4